MKITYIRSSSLNCFDLCEMQYTLNYVLGIPQKTGRKAILGTMTHKVLEILAQCKKTLQNNLSIYDDDICGKVQASEMFNPELIGRIIGEVFIHYKDKSDHVFTNADLKNIGEWVYKTLNFNNGLFDPRKRVIVEVEAPFNFEVEDRWAQYDYGENDLGQLRLKGTIDLITQVREGIYEGIDWKTGRRISWSTGEEKTVDKFMVDPQLRIYHMAMMRLYPHVKQFFPTIFYCNDGGPFTIPLSNNDVGDTKLMLKKTFEDIKGCKNPTLKGGGKHWFCKSVCSYSRSGDCKRIHEKIKKDGIEKTIEEETVSGHSVSYYQNPGA
jgi:hypothetical protein